MNVTKNLSSNSALDASKWSMKVFMMTIFKRKLVKITLMTLHSALFVRKIFPNQTKTIIYKRLGSIIWCTQSVQRTPRKDD